MDKVQDFKKLLEAYAQAERRVEFWKHHGRYNDGNDVAAKKAMQDARRAVVAAFKKGM